MKFTNKEVAHNYYLYQKSRLKQLYKLRINLFLWFVFTLFLIYQFYFGIKDLRIGIYTDIYNSSERIFYELPVLWLLIIIVKFTFFYADKIPLLAKWQDYLERKEFTRLKNSYEFQLKQQNEPPANSNH